MLIELWIDLDVFSKELQEDVQGLTLMELWIDLTGSPRNWKKTYKDKELLQLEIIQDSH